MIKKITCSRKSNYFVLSKNNIIIATETRIWWEHQRSFTSAFQINDPGNFLCFPWQKNCFAKIVYSKYTGFSK